MVFSPFLGFFRQFPTFNLGLAHYGSRPFNYCSISVNTIVAVFIILDINNNIHNNIHVLLPS